MRETIQIKQDKFSIKKRQTRPTTRILFDALLIAMQTAIVLH